MAQSFFPSVSDKSGSVGVRSPGYEFDSIDPDPSYAIEWENLWQVKAWNGFGIGIEYPNPAYVANQAGIWPVGPFWDGTGRPTVTYRQQFRKRYASRALSWGYTDSVGSAGNSGSTALKMAATDPVCPTLSGNWAIPTGGNTGNPENNVNYTDPPSLFGQPQISGGVYTWGNDGFYSFIGIVGDLASGLPPASQSQNFGWTGYTETDLNGATSYSESVSDSMSGDAPFAPILSTARSRILARSFPGTFTAYNTLNEGFSEYYHGISTESDPSNYDGSPTSIGTIPSAVLAFPDFGANTAGDINAIDLASMWFYTGAEEFFISASDAPFMSGVTGVPLVCSRVRFRTSKKKTYWIARARIMPGIGTAQATITDIYYERSGIYRPGQPPVELAINTDDSDFVTTNDRYGVSSLSWGGIRFAIIDETPTHWMARTGYTFAGGYP